MVPEPPWQTTAVRPGADFLGQTGLLLVEHRPGDREDLLLRDRQPNRDPRVANAVKLGGKR